MSVCRLVVASVKNTYILAFYMRRTHDLLNRHGVVGALGKKFDHVRLLSRRPMLSTQMFLHSASIGMGPPRLGFDPAPSALAAQRHRNYAAICPSGLYCRLISFSAFRDVLHKAQFFKLSGQGLPCVLETK